MESEKEREMKKKMIRCSFWILGLVVLAALVISSCVNGITCQDAVTKLLPCQGLLVGFGDISGPCCESADSLNKMLTSKADRKAVCECFKQVVPAIGVNPDRANQLPQLCHITLAVPIGYNTDCDKA